MSTKTFPTAFLLSMTTGVAWEDRPSAEFWGLVADLLEANGLDLGCHPGLATWRGTAANLVNGTVAPDLLERFPWLAKAPAQPDASWLERFVAEHGETQTVEGRAAPALRA
jgi:hypothetical protein